MRDFLFRTLTVVLVVLAVGFLFNDPVEIHTQGWGNAAEVTE